MKHRTNFAAGVSLLPLGLLLAACGGGGVNSTPTPTPTPGTPTPTPGNASLSSLKVSQSFTNDAVTGSAKLRDNITTATDHGPATLQISFDASTGAYTLAQGGKSTTFGSADLVTGGVDGQIDYSKQAAGKTEYLTLTAPGDPINMNTKYVGAAYWQRNSQAGDDLTIDFDAATYGIATANSAVPRSGSAGYEVSLFGFLTPLDAGPKAVSGTGTFTVDFQSGVFSTEGTATESDLTQDYWTGPQSWRGAGHISSSANDFSGNFAYDGRYGETVAGTIDGRFYGPQAQELGAVFDAQNDQGAILVGTIIGAQNAHQQVLPLTVLNSSIARSFYGPQTFNGFVRELDSTAGYGAATNFPGPTTRLDFNADGSVNYIPSLSSNAQTSPTFTAADRVSAQSNARYTVYAKSVDGIDYALTLYNPGAGNTEVPLTYTSFMRWDKVEVDATYEKRLEDWAVYGVPTPAGTLPHTGTADYSMLIHGSGYTFADSARYDVTGNATMHLDLGTLLYSGSFNPVFAPLASGQAVNYGSIGFAGEMGTSYGFENHFDGLDGEMTGRLFGPQGEEIAASWQFLGRDNGGPVISEFAGVMIGKKN